MKDFRFMNIFLFWEVSNNKYLPDFSWLLHNMVKSYWRESPLDNKQPSLLLTVGALWFLSLCSFHSAALNPQWELDCLDMWMCWGVWQKTGSSSSSVSSATNMSTYLDTNYTPEPKGQRVSTGSGRKWGCKIQPLDFSSCSVGDSLRPTLV